MENNTIVFLVTCTLEFYVGIDTVTEEPIIETEEVKKGQEFEDVDITQATNENIWEVQFGNGDVAYVPKQNIKIL